MITSGDIIHLSEHPELMELAFGREAARIAAILERAPKTIRITRVTTNTLKVAAK